MKKKLIVLLTLVALSLTACGNSWYQKEEESRNKSVLFDQFIVVKDNEYSLTKGAWHDFYIVYDKDTKVMYYFAAGDRRAMMSPIYNSDGTVRIWEDN